MKSIWFIALAAIMWLALFSVISVPVAAATTPVIDLQLGDSGATSWNITNIKPGDSGTVPVSLHNAGDRDGVVTIWLSNITNSEGLNPEPETGDLAEPGELGNYLNLNITGANLDTNFILPAKINNFPQSAADSNHIYVNPLKAGSTLSLQWEWRLPSDTGNEVQGDGIVFTINYLLKDLPIEESPHIDITNTGPPSVYVDFTSSYTMTVTNTGPVTLNDVVVTDYLPAELSYQSSIPTGSVNESKVTWNLGTLSPGEQKEIVAILRGERAGAAANIASVSTSEGASASASLDIMVLSSPGASIQIFDTDDPVEVGDTTSYIIQVLNQSSTTDIHNLTITLLIPGQMAYVSADGPTPFTTVDQEVRFAPVATLAPGEELQYQVEVKATASGAAVANATMRWDEFPEPIVSQEGTTIFNPEPSCSVPVEETPQIDITKTGASCILAGFTSSYTITVTNTGPVTLNDVVVTDYLPVEMSYQSSIPTGTINGGKVTWNLGTLAPGEQKEIVAILRGERAGAAASIASVSTSEGISASASMDIMVLSSPGATMQIIDTDDPVAMGDVTGYVIQVVNQSSTMDIHNLTITLLIPCQMAYISADGPTPFTTVDQEIRFAPVATLAPMGKLQYQVRVMTSEAGAAVANATMRWDEFSEPIVSQEGTTIFDPKPLCSVQFVCSGDTTILGVLSDGSTTQPYVARFFESKLILQLDVNTKISLSNGELPENIEVKIAENSLPSGEGKVIVSPIYQINAGCDASGNYREVNFDRPVTITLMYDPAAVPQNATSIHIAYFEGNPDGPNSGWVWLDYPPDYVPETGQVSGVLTHSSLLNFTVIAELPPLAPASSGILIFNSIWLITTILTVIGAAATGFAILFIMKRRRS